MINKNNFKNIFATFGIFLTGMLSVSIANLFGGYYCSALALVAVLSTAYILDVLDRGELENNKLNIILVSVVPFLQLMFFVVNDIFGHQVYNVDGSDFFSKLVIVSQLYCVFMMIANLVKIVLSYVKPKETVEIIEKPSEGLENNNTLNEEDVEDIELDNGNVENLKSIPFMNIKKETPFMEEQK